ncbi:UNVERIFIED_CONTAM: Kunitz-type serine protease inhibitor 3 [Trichonephila clavipes]
MQPMKKGKCCLAYIPSWYYDPMTNKCKKFLYGGCQGNDNRFKSEAECLGTCGKSVLVFERQKVLYLRSICTLHYISILQDKLLSHLTKNP